MSKTDKIMLYGFIILGAILWKCVQTGGHYDFILHKADKGVHKEIQEKLQRQLKEEINPLKSQIEILRTQVNQLGIKEWQERRN